MGAIWSGLGKRSSKSCGGSGEEHDRFASSQPRTLSEEEVRAIRRLSKDIPALWEAPGNDGRRAQGDRPAGTRARGGRR